MTDSTKSPEEKEILDIALRRMPAPVAVIGARRGEITGGLTAAWVTRVSIDPVLILVSIGHERYTYDLMKDTTHFTVSILADNQVPAARLFGLQSRREVDKWSQVDHDLLGEGIPAVRDCAARFLCKVQDVFRTGDHDCFVGEVVTAENPSDRPALPMRGADYAPDGR
jgi:flavin reductase (DIM6/NTAB) family NADH-FMN oxidoreductase RutF